MNPRQRKTLLAICAFSFLCGREALPATFNIADGDVAGLKNAIKTANDNGQADVINLAANGTYTLTAVDNTLNGPNGLPLINDDVAGLDLTIKGNGATLRRSGDPGTPEFRIIQVTGGATVNCDSLTFANGALSGTFPGDRGAGIYVWQAALSLTNCTVQKHIALNGAGIYAQASALTLNGCTISLNQANYGGGIYNFEGAVTGTNSIFSGNAAQGGGTVNTPGFGGAVYNNSGNATTTLTLTDCQLLQNSIVGAGQGLGAAIYNRKQSGTPTVSLTNCTLDNNFGEEAFGAAIGNDGGVVNVTGGAFTNNFCRFGGAIFQSSGSLDIHSATIANNTATKHPITGFGGVGGAIYVAQGNATLIDSTLRANQGAHSGGAIYNNGTFAVTNSGLSENVVNTVGGAIRNDSQVTLTDTELTMNTAALGGGAISSTGNVTLQRCSVNKNTANSGGAGGIYNTGTLTVESSTFESNKALGADGNGGAIGTVNFAGPVQTTLRNSTLSNNTATRGGGINNIGTLTILNSTVSGNMASAEGGGVFNKGGTVTLESATFYGNSAPSAGGIYCANATTNALVVLHNTVLQTGANGANLVKVSGTVTSLGYNLSNDPAGGDGNIGPGGLLNGPNDIRSSVPNLGPLQSNGGPTLTHALVVPSPGIDSGDDQIVDPPLALTTDQRGAGFPRWLGAHVDRGAFESGANSLVTTIDDHDDGACTPSDCTLREAIASVNAVGTGNVSFALGVTGTVQLGGPLPEVSGNLVLDGPGPNLLTVRRNSGGDYGIFRINNGTPNGPHVIIAGLTISNGQTPEGSFPGNSGGGILNRFGTLTVRDCTLAGNHCALVPGSYGGGIFNEEGTLTLETSTVTRNSATYGGGIASFKSYPGTAESVFHGSTIARNTAEGGSGGGIYNEAINAGANAVLTMTNCTLSGNSATVAGFFGGSGGAFFNAGRIGGFAQSSIEDCTIAGNDAPSAGGIYNNNFSATAKLILRNTILKTGTSGENFINSSGQFISLGNNLSSDAAAGSAGTGPGGYLNASGDIRNTDPLLGPLQDNGGPTFTHALLGGSAAINNGVDTDASILDQRRYPRIGTNDIGAFEFGSAAPQALALVGAVSRKTHGGAGSFDVVLPGVECRSGGGSEAYTVVFTFNNPLVSVTSAAVTNGTGSVSSGMIGSDAYQYIVNLSGITNAQSITISLTNVTDSFGSNSPATQATMGILLGDTSGNGVVSATDVSQTKLQSGQAVGAGNFRMDVNANGIINATDVSQIKARSGTGLP